MSSPDSRKFDLLDQLAEEFAQRYRRGERPSLAEYAEKYPDLAEDIRSLFPALVQVEQAEIGHGEPAVRAVSLAPPAPRRIGDYRLLREVGHGGMGVVYEAEQLSLGRRVALKVLPPGAPRDGEALERFRREARSAAKLHHTNIVPVFEVGQDGDACYYAMQFIQGQGLDEVIDELRRLRADGATLDGEQRPPADFGPSGAEVRQVARSLVTGRFRPQDLERATASPPRPGPVPRSQDETAVYSSVMPPPTSPDHPGEKTAISSAVLPGQTELSGAHPGRWHYFRSVADVGRQVAQALAYAHARGVVHRDVKPSNLLLDTAGVVWVTDFGLAKSEDDGLTSPGDIVGTLRYMAPERFRGECDGRADLYGLGLTLYELAVLRPAFESRDKLRLVEQIKGEEPPRPRALDPRVPRDLETVILKAIDKEPRRRYQSAEEMADDLRRFFDDEPIKARRVSTAERFIRWARHHKGVAASLSAVALLLVVLALGSAAAAAYFRRQEAAQRELAEENGRLVESEAEQRKQAETTLYHSLVREAHALRVARRVGYREKAWARLKEALAIDTPARDLHALRREAVASLGDFVGREPVTLGGFANAPGRLAVHPDGEHLVLALADRTLSVRDIDTNRETARLTGMLGTVSEVQVSADGNHVLAADFAGLVKLWERAPDGQWTPTRGERLFRAGSRPTFAIFLPDGRRFATTAQGSTTIGVWDLSDEGLDKTIRLPEGQTVVGHNLAVSPDGQRLAVPHGSHLSILNLETGAVEHWVRPPLLPILKVAFSPDGRFLVCGTDQGFVTYETTAFRQWSLVRLDSVNSLAFTPDSQYLAFATITRKVKLWSLTTQREAASMDHLDRSPGYQTLAVSPDGTRLISAAASSVRIWKLRGLPEKRLLAGHPDGVPCVGFSPDGKLLATGGKDRTARLWEARSGRPLHTFHLKGFVQTVAFSPDGRLLAVGDWSGRDSLTLWDLRTYQCIAAPKHQLGNINHLAFTHDGKHLAAVGHRGLTVFEVVQTDGWPGFELRELDRRGGSRSLYLAVSRDDRTVAWVDDTNRIRVWDLVRRRELPFPRERLLPTGWHNLAFHPDNRHVLFVTASGRAEAWDVFAGRKSYDFADVSRFQSFHVALSPDGRWLACDVEPDAVTLCDTTTRRALFTLGNERAPIWCFAWSPDNRRLAVGLSDGGVVIWDLEAVRAQLKEIGLAW